MRTPAGVLIFVALMLLVDTYVFQAVKTICQDATPKAKTIIFIIYWTISIFAIVGFLLFVYTSPTFLSRRIRTYLFATVVGLFLAKLIAVIFFIADDLRRGIQWIAGKLFFRDTEAEELSDGISRSVFLSWLGVAAGSTLFGSLLYGFSNKYNYHVKRVDLAYTNLPQGFRGITIAHISDIHCGSFMNKSAVMTGIQKVLDLKPELILFTGDLVNDRATEMAEYMDIFSLLKAPLGVYSTFGNHDYGDYVSWPYNSVSKEQNLEDLKKVHAALGWKLLMNEHVNIERNGDSIALMGIENWSAKARFPKHGKMAEAYAGTDKYPFKILMSHDPSHWDAEVRTKYPDVDLTLSGHTHGMQFGIEIPGFKWSPVQFMYKQWAGLYEEGRQKLYVNRGYGFIGYPGRVGVLPEITLIELI